MGASTRPKRVVIMGAAGRDFHNFNVVYRDDPASEVVAFTATQIPGIAGRRYPAELAGDRYRHGIPIVAEAELEATCRREGIDEIVFAYSDVPHIAVMHAASRALAAGADFVLLGPCRTMLPSRRPVVAVSAVRTGAGKSQVARHLSRLLRERRRRVAVIRHPMPYGDLAAQAVQRFAAGADLDAARCSIEEREEYEPHLALGNVVFAGVDYARVLAAAEAEADIILWDGGNNDFPFLVPDLHLVLVDALRPGHETAYHPGEAALRMADVAVIAKANAAEPAQIEALRRTVATLNPPAEIVLAASLVTLDRPELVAGRRVLVVEDGPTLTHGGMATGAGYAAARQANAAAIIDPRPFAAPAIARALADYPHIGPVLPALGYGPEQVAALATTIAAADADAVVVATPIDLAHLARIDRPIVRARYEHADLGAPTLGDIVERFLAGRAS
jgi:predicted GTPase